MARMYSETHGAPDVHYIKDGGSHDGAGGNWWLGIILLIIFLIILFSAFRGRDGGYGGGGNFSEVNAYGGGSVSGLTGARTVLDLLAFQGLTQANSQIDQVKLQNCADTSLIVKTIEHGEQAQLTRELDKANAEIAQLKSQQFTAAEIGKVMGELNSLKFAQVREADHINCQLNAIQHEIPKVAPRFIPTESICSPCCDRDRDRDRPHFVG